VRTVAVRAVGLARVGAQPDQPAAVGTDVPAVQPGLLRRPQVADRPRVGPLHPPERRTGGAGGLAVHRGEDGDLRGGPVTVQLRGDRGVQVVRTCRPRQRGVTGDDGQHAGFDLAQVGAHQHVAGLGGDRHPQPGGEVVQPGARGHPAGRSVGGRPRPAQPAVGADVPVEPAVAVSGGDAFGLAPVEERGHARMGVPEGLQPPGPGVGNPQPDPAEQLAYLHGVAQVDA
jgi:hypothetical protein